MIEFKDIILQSADNGGRFYIEGPNKLWDRHSLDTPMMVDDEFERKTNQIIIDKAKGDVLICGLGIGLIVYPIMEKPEVTSVTILEIHQSVIDLIKPQSNFNSKVKILKQDGFKYIPDKQFDTIWLDDWTTAAEDRERRENGVFVGDSRKQFIEMMKPHLKDGGFIGFWRDGPSPSTYTEHGIYQISDLAEILPIIKEFSLGKTFVDLGSGTGEVVDIAKDYAQNAVGIEIDTSLISENSILGDIIESDLKPYNVAYYYLMGSNREEELREKVRDFNGIIIVHFAGMNEIFAERFCEGFQIIKKFPSTWVIK